LLRPLHSGCGGPGFLGECEADCIDGALASAACGFDDGANVGVEFGSPFGSEAICDFAIDRAGPQGALGAVVGGLDLSVSHEDEEVLAEALDDALHLHSAGAVGMSASRRSSRFSRSAS